MVAMGSNPKCRKDDPEFTERLIYDTRMPLRKEVPVLGKTVQGPCLLAALEVTGISLGGESPEWHIRKISAYPPRPP